jgi:menaquinone-dependent protoporphyrinogen oxidase
MMRVLVTAATKYGATAEIAQAIADALRDHGLEPTVLPPEQVEGIDGHDAVVLGSAVYAGHWLKPAREHRVFAGTLDRRQLSFPERAIVSALRVLEGDFRDWAEITRWAAEIAGALQAGGGGDDRQG